MKKQIVIGMSGHIDHGKTSVVKALTGQDTDKLDQEKERGMTIDIGFAHLSDKITIIDVPGHEKFIKNMVTGVSYIDFAVLVVAADDGVMPQTKEHFEILKILNIKKGMILINKIDLVKEDWIDLVESDIQDLIKGSFLENQPIIRVSATQNIGIDQLKEVLLDTSVLKDKTINHNRGVFRMYVDRVFSQQGFGTVVTGTVLSSGIKIKDSINVLPINKKARLRSAQSHHNQVEELNIGDRAALNLHGIEKNEISRGDHLSNLDAFNVINQFLANITILKKDDIVLKQNQRLRFHIGTSEVIGRISICEKNTIQSGENAICLIKLEQPIVASFQDQFLIRTYSPMKTIGGGVVEDINCLGKWKDLKQYAIKLLENKSIQDKISFITEKQKGSPFKKEEIISRIGMSFEKIIEYLDLTQNYKIIEYLSEKWIVTESQLEKFLNNILKEVEKFHIDNPYRSGALKKELYQKIKSDETFLDFCIEELIKMSEINQNKELITLKDFKVNLSDDERVIQEKVIQILDQQGFSSQNYIEIADSLNISPDKLKILINIAEKDQKIIRINEELLFTSSNFNNLVKEIRGYFSKNNKLTVSEFKNIAKTSRKYAVPLLEYFDKQKITYREDNYRKLA